MGTAEKSDYEKYQFQWSYEFCAHNFFFVVERHETFRGIIKSVTWGGGC